MDLCLLTIAHALANVFIFGLPLSELHIFDYDLRLYSLAWALTYLFYIDDLQHIKLCIDEMIKYNSLKFFIFTGICAMSIIALGSSKFILSSFFPTVGVFYILKVSLALWLFYFYVRKDRTGWRKVLIIGNNLVGKKIFKYFQTHAFLGLIPIGILDL